MKSPRPFFFLRLIAGSCRKQMVVYSNIKFGNGIQSSSCDLKRKLLDKLRY